ncbi:membrane lipoprotein lipid attachment site-containing protein [Pantoea endophytica]|uniref:membrane lipoprotein lipid attachment site-containing protein n=1 Tax=Pantoea endophytica TaxID=92488 RepID=UPI0024135718|nr:membrane lipoprotein lipid attachment site-containing protein [Pantoea endophytica]
MKKMLISALALFMLTGCSVSKPGGFERVDEDTSSNTVQYRYDPHTLNKDAMEIDLANYCSQRGFDKVESLPSQNSHLPGLKKAWYQCNYAVKS